MARVRQATTAPSQPTEKMTCAVSVNLRRRSVIVMACEYWLTPSSAAFLAVGPERFIRRPFGWKIEGSCLEIEFPFSRRQLRVCLADSALPVEIFLGALCRQGYRYQPRRTPHPVRWKPRSLQSRADFGLDHDCQKYPASSSASAPYRIGPIRRPSQWDRGCRLSAAMAKPYPDGSWTGRGLDSSCSSPWFRDQPSLEFFSRSLCSYSALLYRPTNNIRKALEDTNIRKGCAQERHYCCKQ